jgi:hypothetical protein
VPIQVIHLWGLLPFRACGRRLQGERQVASSARFALAIVVNFVGILYGTVGSGTFVLDLLGITRPGGDEGRT